MGISPSPTRNRAAITDLHYLPQQPLIVPRWTVHKQLRYWAKRGGEPLVIDAALQYFDLKAVENQTIRHLSSGMQQRVWLAKLMVQPRAIWLLDRPLTGLDAEGLGMAERLIATRCQQNGIVLMVEERQNRLNPHHTLVMEDFF